MIAMCRELGMQVVAEGIETPEERDAMVNAGCDLLQGYLFAKPGAAFPGVSL
jgi:EAL domain-containing protein (putative c-di-GMP-specific phosphodiesterase class I)